MKTALIGNGYWGSKILKYLPEFFDIKYIANSKTDLKTIWNDNDVDSVIIATPIDIHYKIAKEALLNNKNVFVEKPISLFIDEALELEDLAKNLNLKLAVEYTQMFSKSINKFLQDEKSKKIKYIEMSSKHLGRFMEYDVYWLLASHHLSVLDKFFDLDTLKITFENKLYNKNICTTGTIFCSNKARIDVSLNYYPKEFHINFYGDNFFARYNPMDNEPFVIIEYDKKYKKLSDELITNKISYNFDERNNLRNAIEYFKNLLEGKESSNLKTAIKITKNLAR